MFFFLKKNCYIIKFYIMWILKIKFLEHDLFSLDFIANKFNHFAVPKVFFTKYHWLTNWTCTKTTLFI